MSSESPQDKSVHSNNDDPPGTHVGHDRPSNQHQTQPYLRPTLSPERGQAPSGTTNWSTAATEGSPASQQALAFSPSDGKVPTTMRPCIFGAPQRDSGVTSTSTFSLECPPDVQAGDGDNFSDLDSLFEDSDFEIRNTLPEPSYEKYGREREFPEGPWFSVAGGEGVTLHVSQNALLWTTLSGETGDDAEEDEEFHLLELNRVEGIAMVDGGDMKNTSKGKEREHHDDGQCCDPLDKISFSRSSEYGAEPSTSLKSCECSNKRKCHCLPQLCKCPGCLEHSHPVEHGGSVEAHPKTQLYRQDQGVHEVLVHRIDGDLGVPVQLARDIARQLLHRFHTKFVPPSAKIFERGGEIETALFDFCHFMDEGGRARVRRLAMASACACRAPGGQCTCQACYNCGGCRASEEAPPGADCCYLDPEEEGLESSGFRPATVQESIVWSVAATMALDMHQCEKQKYFATLEAARNRRHPLKLSDMVSGSPLNIFGESAATPKAAGDYGPQTATSRPDTPRPVMDSTGAILMSRPYGYEMMQEHIQQSVEAKGPGRNWQRNLTPGYDNRSETPSPFSAAEPDVMMRDASDYSPPLNLGRAGSQAPAGLQPDFEGKVSSPGKPKLPPIPGSSGPLKQPKRGDSPKSGVQGAKVDKRAVTRTPSKSTPKAKGRNVTRKPTASVRKLVEQAKKLGKSAAEHGQSTGERRTVTWSKVVAVVDTIEKDLRQQDDRDGDEDRDRK